MLTIKKSFFYFLILFGIWPYAIGDIQLIVQWIQRRHVLPPAMLRALPYVFILVACSIIWPCVKDLIIGRPQPYPVLSPADVEVVLAELKSQIIPPADGQLREVFPVIVKLRESQPARKGGWAFLASGFNYIVRKEIEGGQGHVEMGNSPASDLESEGSNNQPLHHVAEIVLSNGVSRDSSHGKEAACPVSEILPSNVIGNGSSTSGVEVEAVLTTNGKKDIGEIVKMFNPDRGIAKGSKVLRRTVTMALEGGKVDFDQASKDAIINSVKSAYDADRNFTLQLGSLAGFKCADGHLKMWSLQKNWTPNIHSIHRSWSLVNLFTGEPVKWIMKVENFRDTTVLKAATDDQNEIMTVIHESYEVETGLYVVICEEPSIIRNSAPFFKSKLIISASEYIKVEEGVTFNLQSEAQNIPKAYWISVVDGLIPKPSTAIVMAIFLLLSSLSFSGSARSLQDYLYAAALPVFITILWLFVRDARTIQGNRAMSTVDELLSLWGRDRTVPILERTVRDAVKFALSSNENESSVVLMAPARHGKRIRLARKDVSNEALVVRLLGGEVHPDVHVHATNCLADLAESSPNQLRIASYSGVLDALTSHLQKVDSTSVPGQVQENILRCLANLAQTEGNHMRMASSSVLDLLVKLLGNDTPPQVHQQAGRCLTNLAVSNDNKERIANHPGLLGALATLLCKPRDKDGGSAVQRQTLKCLTNLASSQTVQLKLVSEFPVVLDALVRVLGEDETSAVQRQSLNCLTNLSDHYKKNQIEIASHSGVLDALLRLLRHNWVTTDKIKVQLEAAKCFLKLLSASENLVRISSHACTFDALIKCLEPGARIREVQNLAVACLTHLAKAPENQVHIVSFPGSVPALVYHLAQVDNSKGQELAVNCFGELASVSEAKVLLSCHPGLLEALLAMLNGPTTSFLEPGMKCLLRLSQSEEVGVPAKIISEPGAIDTLVRLLGNHLDVPIQEYAADCLSNLALTPRNAEQIVSHPNVLLSLVNMLQLDANSGVLECTAKCLTKLAVTDEIQVKMASFPGMLNALVLSLSVRGKITQGVQEQVVKCLVQLSAQRANLSKIASYPGVYDALSALAIDDSHPRVKQQAGMCLGYLKLNAIEEGKCREHLRHPLQLIGPQTGQIMPGYEFMSDIDHCASCKDLVTSDGPVKCSKGFTFDRLTQRNHMQTPSSGLLDPLVEVEENHAPPRVHQQAAPARIQAEQYCNTCIPTSLHKCFSAPQVSLQANSLRLSYVDNSTGDRTMNTVDELVRLWGRDRTPHVLQRTVKDALQFSLQSADKRVSSVLYLPGPALHRKKIRLARKDVCDGVLVVRLLGGEVHPDVHVHATNCLADLAESSPNQFQTIASYSDVLDALTSHLQKVDSTWVPGKLQENTLRCLANLAQTKENHMQMASSSVLDLLVKLLGNDAPAPVQMQSARCLTNLAVWKDNKERIANYPGLLDVFATLLHKPSPKNGGSTVHIHALECLTNLASSQTVQLKIVSEFPIVLDALVRTLGEKRTADVQGQSLKCLTNLSDHYQTNQIGIASHRGVLDALLRLLRHNWATTNKIKVQFEAAKSFLKLLSTPENLVRISSHAGTFDALIRCLEPGARIREVQNLAVACLTRLATAPENQAKIVSFPGAVSALLKQLAQVDNSDGQVHNSGGQVLAASCLSKLATASEAKILLACQPGLLQALLAMLNGRSTSLLELGMKCLLRLSQSEEVRVRVRITSQHGVLDALVRLLGNNWDATRQKNAASCLSNLALTPQNAEQIVSHPKVLISLVNVLEVNGNSGVLEYTAKCLANLAVTDEIQFKLASFPGILNALVPLVSVRDKFTWEGVQEQVVKCLVQLSIQPANQFKIASLPGIYDALRALARNNSHPRAKKQAKICLANLKLNLDLTEEDRITLHPQQPTGPQRRRMTSFESMFDPDAWFVDPVTWDTMCDPVKCNDGVTYDRWTIINNRIQESPYDCRLTGFCIACDDIDVRKRLFRALPQQETKFRALRESYRERALQSARALDDEDAIEQLSNVLKWAPSDAECRCTLDEILNLRSGKPLSLNVDAGSRKSSGILR